MANNSKLITVVGGSGFIGQYIVRQLAREGYRLRVLCRDQEGASFLRPLGDVGQIVPEFFDLARAENVAARLAGSYAVINLVGLLYERGSQSFDNLHVTGAQKLAQAAAAVGAERFIQFSALGIDQAGKSRYARTKGYGEQLIKEAFPMATILRPSVVFGREDRFFNQFANMARTGFLPLIGGGRTKFQPVYVADVALAVSAALSRQDVQGKTFELGGPERLSMRAIYDFIARSTDRNIRYVDLPFAIAGIMGSVAGFLPKPMLTADQVRLLKHDSVVSPGALTLRDLGIDPKAIELVVPDYLDRFRLRTPLPA